MRPKYDYGDSLRLTRNIRNDGTYGGEEMGTLLMHKGSVGHVVDIGTFLQDQIIYSIHFLEDSRVVGCREEELIPADAPWEPSSFEFRDKVSAAIPLALNGEVIVEQGTVGDIERVIGQENRYTGPFQYYVRFEGAGKTLQVPESALNLVEEFIQSSQGED